LRANWTEQDIAVCGQGENTLTVRNGQIDLAPALYKGKRLDEVRGSEEVEPPRLPCWSRSLNAMPPSSRKELGAPSPRARGKTQEQVNAAVGPSATKIHPQ
jgi:hypothetical protein